MQWKLGDAEEVLVLTYTWRRVQVQRRGCDQADAASP
jgi:hypothetical protein